MPSARKSAAVAFARSRASVELCWAYPVTVTVAPASSFALRLVIARCSALPSVLLFGAKPSVSGAGRVVLVAVAEANEIVVGADDTPSVRAVAVTIQAPALVAVISLPLITHPSAVPL